LSLIEPGHPGAFDCADVDEDVFAAIIRLDEAKALLIIERPTVIASSMMLRPRLGTR
jgi:hypothetical protein